VRRSVDAPLLPDCELVWNSAAGHHSDARTRSPSTTDGVGACWFIFIQWPSSGCRAGRAGVEFRDRVGVSQLVIDGLDVLLLAGMKVTPFLPCISLRGS